VTAVSALTIANGGDNIATYVALLAGRSAVEFALFGAVFALLTGLWCLAALKLVRAARVRAWLGRNAARVSGGLLIALGLVLLAGTR
jgi:cadmium resistance protein CadD (predicted permease)